MDADPPRFLARTNRSVPRRRSGQPATMSVDEAEGYTTKRRLAMRDEPEPVSRLEQARISGGARGEWVARLEAEDERRRDRVAQQLRSAIEQLRATVRAAEAAGRDAGVLLAEVGRVLKRWD